MNNKKKINIFMYENIMHYPPTISLIQCLLNNGHSVKLISQGAELLNKEILTNNKFSYYSVKVPKKKSFFSRIYRRLSFKKQIISEYNKMDKNDIIWTVNPLIIRTIGPRLLKCTNKRIMQMLELKSSFSLFYKSRFMKFDLKPYAQKAWKVVVAEKNRAYIQKVGWKLEKTPYILPNKPYYFNIKEESDDIKQKIDIMKNEKRKIIIYLGVIDSDRNLEPFAKAIEKNKNEYAFYIFGKVGEESRIKFEHFCNKYDCIKYMGFFNPPQHLNFIKYARMALLPYSPESSSGYEFDILNALYCAPNKIYEYAGCSVPMIGTDVLGLREPFEKYNIGICCKDLKIETIEEAIKYVDKNYEIMRKNSKLFFDSINIDDIVNKIINE